MTQHALLTLFTPSNRFSLHNLAMAPLCGDFQSDYVERMGMRGWELWIERWVEADRCLPVHLLPVYTWAFSQTLLPKSKLKFSVNTVQCASSVAPIFLRDQMRKAILIQVLPFKPQKNWSVRCKNRCNKHFSWQKNVGRSFLGLFCCENYRVHEWVFSRLFLRLWCDRTDLGSNMRS